MIGQLQGLAALPLGKKPGTHLIGGWVGPSDCVDVQKKENIFPWWDSNSGLSSPYPVAIPTTTSHFQIISLTSKIWRSSTRYKNPVSISRKRHCFYITKANWLIHFWYVKCIHYQKIWNTVPELSSKYSVCGQSQSKAGGVYRCWLTPWSVYSLRNERCLN